MKNRIKILFLILAAMATSVSVAAASPKVWELVKIEKENTRLVIKDADTEIRTQPGAIIVISSKPVEIKVFTILGQLISKEQLPAATSRLSIPSHGVYIVKAGELTGKVAL